MIAHVGDGMLSSQVKMVGEPRLATAGATVILWQEGHREKWCSQGSQRKQVRGRRIEHLLQTQRRLSHYGDAPKTKNKEASLFFPSFSLLPMLPIGRMELGPADLVESDP